MVPARVFPSGLHPTPMPEASSTVLFQHPSRAISRRALKAFVNDLARRLGQGPVTCLVATDADLRELNRKFRGKDDATDVLSFPSAGTGSTALGEIAVSLDRAAEQACNFGHSLEEEVRILILHGMLHLTGLDHERDNGEMERAERLWRRRLRLPLGLVERTRNPASARSAGKRPAAPARRKSASRGRPL
jgi:probable rRNA maturation factor